MFTKLQLGVLRILKNHSINSYNKLSIIGMLFVKLPRIQSFSLSNLNKTFFMIKPKLHPQFWNKFTHIFLWSFLFTCIIFPKLNSWKITLTQPFGMPHCVSQELTVLCSMAAFSCVLFQQGLTRNTSQESRRIFSNYIFSQNINFISYLTH